MADSAHFCVFFCRCAYEQSSLRTAWETLLQEIITDVKVFDTLYTGYFGDLLWNLGLGFGQVRSWTLSAKILRNRRRLIIHFRIYSWLWNLKNYFPQRPWIRNTKIVLDFIACLKPEPCNNNSVPPWWLRGKGVVPSWMMKRQLQHLTLGGLMWQMDGLLLYIYP